MVHGVSLLFLVFPRQFLMVLCGSLWFLVVFFMALGDSLGSWLFLVVLGGF